MQLVLHYDGSGFSGWQRQPEQRTVQSVLEGALERLCGVAIAALGSGRTDAGVHALAQVAHLELYTDVSPEQLRRKVNDELPSDIHIISADTAPHRFHARHDAVARSYVYQVSRRRTAFGKPFVWWIREALDVAAMREAAALFVGLKDFHGFTDDDPAEKSTLVLVDGIEIVEEGALVLIRIRGSHFLWKMVRRIVGVLAAVGRGELKPGDALDEHVDVAALTAPAAGLFLEGVYYSKSEGPGALVGLLRIGGV